MNFTRTWNTARNLLGQILNLSPSSIILEREGKEERITNPKELADEFNSYFRKKVTNLRDKTDSAPVILPTERLKTWLDSKDNDIPPFQFKSIDRTLLRKVLKKFK